MIYAINMMLAITWFVFLNIWRWDGAGKVCSGHYLGAEPSASAKAGYLYQEGLFLKWVLVIVYIVFGAGLITVCCVALFFAQKKPADEVFGQKGLFGEKVQPAWQTDVEVQRRISDAKKRPQG